MTGSTACSETNFGPTGRHLAPFPALLPLFQCMLEVVFWEGVQHRLRFFLDHLIVSKWRPSSFIFNQGNRKLGWVGDDSPVVFGKKKKSLVKNVV
jgi:hypothetical protein